MGLLFNVFVNIIQSFTVFSYGAKLRCFSTSYVSQKVSNVSPKAQIIWRSPDNALILRHGKG